jgi:hypothetical protein
VGVRPNPSLHRKRYSRLRRLPRSGELKRLCSFWVATTVRKIRPRRKGHKNIYVHNDLSNAAHHFKEHIEAKLKAGDREGIAFKYMACLILLAFTFESKINFLGHKLISDWKERQPFNDKVSEVLDYLKLQRDWVIPGSGGVRKARWARPGMGKRGGLRIIYYVRYKPDEFWMLTLYAKAKRENVPSHILKQLLEAFRHG